ncbi:dihydrofolate reductase [Leucobacter sp. CSA2]|uniref:Dihydrofolate reductase n=1 Tax=Leucobacter edaphi TaxID=2796472 RepID=A0A934UX27_9MICO|nr:dihydrofolate reductase [Leucobacter edaphi]MBK0420873.1 dihydrofolate reductase [Leucobacter edaphi]
MVWAEARGGAIGRGGEMPWHLPEDLAHFKRTTLGAPVIMGRRTWDSLPERFRPLPGRTNVVVTRAADFAAPGALVAGSLEAAIGLAGAGAADAGGAGGGASLERPVSKDPVPDRAWIMGGGELYREAMQHADELIVTRIDLEVSGADTFAPEIGPEWELADPGVAAVSASGLGYRFERWVRAGSAER